MSTSCGDCRLLESRVAQHRDDLHAAQRRAQVSGRDDARREVALTAQRLHKAQAYLRDHRARRH